MNTDTELWLIDVSDPNYRAGLRVRLAERKMSMAAFARMCDRSPSWVAATLRNTTPDRFPKNLWRVARERLNYPAPLPVEEVDCDDPFWHLR